MIHPPNSNGIPSEVKHKFLAVCNALGANDTQALYQTWCAMTPDDVVALAKAFYIDPVKIARYKFRKGMSDAVR